MTFKNETIKFDGENSGIIAQIKNVNGNKIRFITLNNKPRLFNNIDVARIMAGVIMEDNSFSYWIYTGSMKNIININKCKYNKRRHTFQYIDMENKVIYNFIEERKHRLSNLGYLVFDEGDVKRTDKEIGVLRQKELVGYIADIASGLLGEKWEDYGVSLIEVKRKEVVLHIKSTTTKIHIASNSKIMDINQAKGLTPGVKRIPFIKSMDKFVTFYVFSSKDIGEGKRVGGDEKAKYIIDCIVNDLKRYYPESNPKLERIDYTGFLDLED